MKTLRFLILGLLAVTAVLRPFNGAGQSGVPVTPVAVRVNANQLEAAHGRPLELINLTSGPLTNDTFATYAYDTRNRLFTVGGVTNVYDALNNRYGQAYGTNTTAFVINPNAKLPQILMRIKSGVTNYYIYGPGLLYQITETATATNTLTYHYDYRGSTIALSDSNGNVTDRIEYSAYGLTTYRAGTNDTPFLFNGRYGVQTDPNGLLYMRARYYNPYLCRFINPDPTGFKGGLNMYAYANGNPVRLLDPFGLGAIDDNSITSWLTEPPSWAIDEANAASAQNGGSNPLMLLPGATSWNGAVSSFQSGNYVNTVLYGVAMVSEDVILALTAGESGPAISSLNAAETTAAEQGGLNLFKFGDSTSTTASRWSQGDYFLNLPNQGSPVANWAQNSSALRSVMSEGNPIYDSYIDAATSQQIPTTGFLNAERNLLENHGWNFNPQTGAYHPPVSP